MFPSLLTFHLPAAGAAGDGMRGLAVRQQGGPEGEVVDKDPRLKL